MSRMFFEAAHLITQSSDHLEEAAEAASPQLPLRSNPLRSATSLVLRREELTGKHEHVAVTERKLSKAVEITRISRIHIEAADFIAQSSGRVLEEASYNISQVEFRLPFRGELDQLTRFMARLSIAGSISISFHSLRLRPAPICSGRRF